MLKHDAYLSWQAMRIPLLSAFIALAAALAAPESIRAQQRTSTLELWLAGGLGAGVEREICSRCASPPTASGPYVSLAAGVGLSARLGLAIELLEWGSLEIASRHASVQTVSLAIGSRRGRRILAGMGKGRFWVPTSDSREPNATGPVLSLSLEGPVAPWEHFSLEWAVGLRQLLSGRHGGIPTGATTVTPRGSYLASLVVVGFRLRAST